MKPNLTRNPAHWLPGFVLVLLTAAVVHPAGAQDPHTWNGYTLGSTATPVPMPANAEELNSVLPEPAGGYVAVWDTAASAILQRRDEEGALRWSWTPPTPLPVASELTRAVFGSRNRILWCSTARWFFLDREWGTVIRSGSWTLPYLDPSRIVIQNENLHMLYEGSSLIYVHNVGLVKVTYASVYNTNMDFQNIISTYMPPGYWHNFGGAWLLDMNQRTNQIIRLCTLGNNLAMGTPFNVALPSGATGGYVDHRVLGADTNSIFVVSSVHWPHLGETVHYFTQVDRTGSVRAQHVLAVNQIITGAAAVNDGWVLSGQYFNDVAPQHVFFKLDANGRPAWQTQVDSGGPFSYRMLNVNPPRVLKLLSSTNTIILPTETHSWAEVGSENRLEPAVNWSDDPPPMPASPTNHFWITPIRLNQL